ncbi:MAG: malonyl-ACP O-methyltransferase BioC [bacterium]
MRLQKPDTFRIHQRFSRSLATYQEAAVVQKRMASALNEILTQTTSKRVFETVLELGCGTGLLTDAFASCFTWEKFYLYDLIAECSRYHEHRTNTQFHVADINVFDAYPQADLILSGATFQWIHDIDALLIRLGHALKPGGILAFTSFAPGNLMEVSAVTGSSLSYFTEPQLCNTLTKAGFHVSAFETQIMIEHFFSPRAVLAHLKATGVTATSENRVWTKASLQAFEEQYHALKTADGLYPLTYTPLYCVAEKRSYSKE